MHPVEVLPDLLILPLPAGNYSPCSSCRFQPASTFPALPAVPPGTDLTCSSRHPAGISPPAQPPFRRYLTLLLPLPFPAGPYLSTHPAIPEESSPPAFNKLYLNSVKFCLSLRWGPNLKRNRNRIIRPKNGPRRDRTTRLCFF